MKDSTKRDVRHTGSGAAMSYSNSAKPMKQAKTLMSNANREKASP